MLCPRARCVHDCACCSHDRCWCCCAGSRRGAAPCTGGRAACDAAAVAVNGAVCGGSRAPSSPRRRARSPAAGAPPSPRWCCRRAAATAARLALSHSLQNLGGSTSCKSCSPTHPFAPSRFAMCDTGRVPRAARPPPGGPASRGGGGASRVLHEVLHSANHGRVTLPGGASSRPDGIKESLVILSSCLTPQTTPPPITGCLGRGPRHKTHLQHLSHLPALYVSPHPRLCRLLRQHTPRWPRSPW